MDPKSTDASASELDAKLTEAAEESSTTETETTETTETTTETKAKGAENRIPQDRFNKVNADLKDERAAGETARGQLAEAQAALVTLTERMAKSDEDVRTLNEIKSYVNDPTMADHVIAIDNRLKGIEAEVESGETTPEDALEKTQRLLVLSEPEFLQEESF